MSKQLITVDTLDSHIEDGRCVLGPDMILTPGAKDELARRRVRIVYGEKACAASSCGCGSGSDACVNAAAVAGARSDLKGEDLVLAVAALIRKECGISDPERLRAVTCEALKRLASRLR